MKKLKYFLFFILTFSLKASLAQSTEEKLALMFFREGNYEKAASLYYELYEKTPTLFYYTYYLQSLLELNDFSTAEKFVKKLTREHPETSRYIIDLGHIYIQWNESEKAKKIFEDAIKEVKPEKRSITDLANAFRVRRLDDYAVRTYEKGREILKSESEFSVELAGIYSNLGQYEKEMEEYFRLLESDPGQMKTIQHRLQNSLNNDPENRKSDIFRIELLKRAQKYPEKEYYSEMMLWYSIQQKEFELALTQAKSLDRRLNEEGERLFELAGLSESNGNYNVAVNAYEYILEKGTENPFYVESRIRILNARYMRITSRFEINQGELEILETDYKKTIEEFGKNNSTLPLMRYLAHIQGFYLNKLEESKSLLEEVIGFPNIPPLIKAECKLELGDLLLYSGDEWDATLLYSQVDKAFKDDPIGHEARFKNAKLSFYIGEFEWCKAQLDVLKAATSKLIANDAMELSLLIGDNLNMDTTERALRLYAAADLLIYRNQYDQALVLLDSIKKIESWHPLFDEVLYKKAEISIKRGNFLQAAARLEQLLKEYPYDILGDNAAIQLARLYDFQIQDKSKAMEYYQLLLSDYPGSVYTVEARKRFRELRGDPVN